LFDHHQFEKYGFEEIPANEELFLMDEVWLEEYEKSLLNVFEGGSYENVGYVSYAVKRASSESAIELSWYPNTTTRFHEVLISLPREMFVMCIGSHDWDKPRLFVKSVWLNNLHMRSYSVFAFGGCDRCQRCAQKRFTN
jgi:hypothetical protein